MNLLLCNTKIINAQNVGTEVSQQNFQSFKIKSLPCLYAHCLDMSSSLQQTQFSLEIFLNSVQINSLQQLMQ